MYVSCRDHGLYCTGYIRIVEELQTQDRIHEVTSSSGSYRAGGDTRRQLKD